MLARAIRGSNSIEGYVVEEDDAAAAIDVAEPLSADQPTFAEIRGYRQALGYVLQMATDRHFTFDTSTIRSMHYMMLAHDLSKNPGQYRTSTIYVHDEKTNGNVYEGPDATLVPVLMEAFAESLRAGADTDPNLVMIHPFRDGIGRMARALQTLVLSRHAIVEPAFSSIEEWLGENTEDYYRVLALTGRGSWQPRADPTSGSRSTCAPITCRRRPLPAGSRRHSPSGPNSTSWSPSTTCPNVSRNSSTKRCSDTVCAVRDMSKRPGSKCARRAGTWPSSRRSTYCGPSARQGAGST